MLPFLLYFRCIPIMKVSCWCISNFNMSYATQTCCDLNEYWRRLLCVVVKASVAVLIFHNPSPTITIFIFVILTEKREKLICSQQKPFLIESISLLDDVLITKKHSTSHTHTQTKHIYIYYCTKYVLVYLDTICWQEIGPNT